MLLCRRSSAEPILLGPQCPAEQVLYDLDCSFYLPEAEVMRRTELTDRTVFAQFLLW